MVLLFVFYFLSLLNSHKYHVFLLLINAFSSYLFSLFPCAYFDDHLQSAQIEFLVLLAVFLLNEHLIYTVF